MNYGPYNTLPFSGNNATNVRAPTIQPYTIHLQSNNHIAYNITIPTRGNMRRAKLSRRIVITEQHTLLILC